MIRVIIVSGSVGIDAFRSLISVMESATKVCRNVVTLDLVFQRFRLPTHIGLVTVNAYQRNRNVNATVVWVLLNVENGVYFQAN